MPFKYACTLDDLWEGEMKEVTVDGTRVLVVHAEGGHIGAFAASCPHQEYPLIDGLLEGNVLTCSAHLWQFDAVTGAGINPSECALQRFAIKVEGEEILVDTGQPGAGL